MSTPITTIPMNKTVSISVMIMQTNVMLPPHSLPSHQSLSACWHGPKKIVSFEESNSHSRTARWW